MKTHLVFAGMTIALLALVISQTGRKTFTFDHVIEQAARLSREPYQPRPLVKSAALRGLNYDQQRDIRWKEDQTLWRNLGLPFQARFIITGGAHHSEPIAVYKVGPDSAGQIRYSPDFFDYGKNTLSAEDRAAGAYAGFRIYYPINKADHLDEVLVFLGASYFRAVAKDQQWGLSARGIAIDTGLDKKEEFPAFTAFWLVEPARTDNRLRIYALLDGPSVTGAYEFDLEPGVETRVDVHAILFFRAKVESLGLAPLTSMFWYGENTGDTFGNWRPEVHDSDGLLLERENGEWLWHPLAWAKKTQLNVFAAPNLKGFGLIQRDRVFAHYQDLEAKYDHRPSVWVTPHGEWGPGAVKLVQLSATDEYVDNVVAFWSPEKSPAKGERLEIRYTLNWYGENDGRPPTGRCISTRIDSQQTAYDAQQAPFDSRAYYRLFVLDFWGPELTNLPENAPLQFESWAGEESEISDVRVQKNPNDNTWRVAFTASTKQLRKPIELGGKLLLDGRPLTETWTYTWTP